MQSAFDFSEASICTALIRYRGDQRCSSLGWLGPHHCWLCAIRVAEMCNQFDADVVAGKYDAEGYTPNERRAQKKKAKAG